MFWVFYAVLQIIMFRSRFSYCIMLRTNLLDVGTVSPLGEDSVTLNQLGRMVSVAELEGDNVETGLSGNVSSMLK